MSNRLDPDQVRHIVGLDLCSNCMQRLSYQQRALIDKKLTLILPIILKFSFVLKI